MKKILVGLTLSILALTGAIVYNAVAPKAEAVYTSQSYAAARKNIIINGDMQVYQRGSVSVSGFALDRWYYENVTSGTCTTSQSSTVPTFAQSGENFKFSMLVDTQTIESGPTGGEACDLIYRVEGLDWRAADGKYLTCSFWVRSTKTGTFTFSLSNSANDRNYVSQYTVSSTDTWEKKTIVVPPNTLGGTWLFDTGIGANIRWFLAAGASYNTGANNAWNSTSLGFGTSGQVNALDNVANNFYLTGVQLEVGAQATSFEFLPFQQQMALCQRYYEKSYDQGTLPGSVSASSYYTFYTESAANQQRYGSVPYRVSKRSGGTVRIWSYAGTSGKVGDVNGTDSANANTATLFDSTEHQFTLFNNSGSVYTPTGKLVIFHWDVNDEF